MGNALPTHVEGGTLTAQRTGGPGLIGGRGQGLRPNGDQRVVASAYTDHCVCNSRNNKMQHMQTNAP